MRHAAAALLALLTLAAMPARAEVHAVLIGVGDYLYLDADLKGPPNDARLMAETLTARGVAPEAITVLSTDLTGLPEGVATGAPSRDGIFAVLEATTARARPGDTLFFYFSGHGAQAPDLSGDEGGGYDEIFLPMDARNWKGEIGMVENAIIDDELQLWAQTVLSRGVKLIGVIDACHSATGFRAIGGTGVARNLDETLLGIPDDITPAPYAPVAPLSGDFAFLYSSQSDERSFEYPLGDSGIWHGEFTLRLSQVLSAAPQATWAQVLASTADAMVQGPARQTPEGEGPLLATAVFGQGSGSTRFRLTGDELSAGLLQGIGPGAELALYAQGAGGEPVAEARVKSSRPRSARLEAPPPAAAAWAELIAPAPPAPLALAAAVRRDPQDGFDYSEWMAALPAPSPGAADFVPVLTDGMIALAGPDGLLDAAGPGATPRVLSEPGESKAEAVSRALATATHGLRLRDVLATAAGRGLSGTPVLTTGIERRIGQRIGNSCSPDSGPPVPHDPQAGVGSCDQLWLHVTNSSGKVQDVSVLYLARDFTVQAIWPMANMVNRLAPGESAEIGLQIEPFDAPGTEEIWLLAVPVEASRARVDLTPLAAAQTNRAIGGGGMLGWLDARMQPADPETDTLQRGFSLKPADLTMIRQTVRLLPED